MVSNMKNMAQPKLSEVIVFPTGLRFEISGPRDCDRTLAVAWVRTNLPADLAGVPLKAQTSTSTPSFDEWFKARNFGASFDAMHFQGGTMWDVAMSALAREMRDYTTEMVRRAVGDAK